MKEIAITKVNNVKIVVYQDPNQLVPIRPICDALGINFASQYQRIKRDEIYNSVVVVTTTTGSDKKQYEMVTLPMKYIFGWLMSIDTSRVNEESRPAIIKYKLECHDALYDYFAGAQAFLKEREALIYEQKKILSESRANARKLYQKVLEKKKELQDVFAVDYETWIKNGGSIFPPESELKKEEKED